MEKSKDSSVKEKYNAFNYLLAQRITIQQREERDEADKRVTNKK